jgi:Tfp pilus assembly protein PilZ
LATAIKCRRRFDRIALKAGAEISTPLMGDTTISASMIQLGKGGGLLACDLFMGIGRIITVDIAVHNRPVRAIAKVLYEYRNLTGKIHTGIGFEYMDDEHDCHLREFIDVKLEENTQRQSNPPPQP